MSQPASSNPRFIPQRIYAKLIQMEGLNTPDIFLEKFEPELNIGFDVTYKKLAKDDVSDANYEVVVASKVEIKIGEKEAIRLLAVQAGAFVIEGLKDPDLDRFIRVECAGFLFPYLRELIDSSVVKASLPPVLLPPVDFFKLFQERNKQNEAGAGTAPVSDSETGGGKDAELEKLRQEVENLKKSAVEKAASPAKSASKKSKK